MTALDLLLNPALLEAAKQYFAEQTKETKWRSLIPLDQKPPVDLNKERMERFRPQMQKYYYDPSRYPTYLEQLGVSYPTVKKP
jgi:aminobenzoyl-glutamate utilization protein B